MGDHSSLRSVGEVGLLPGNPVSPGIFQGMVAGGEEERPHIGNSYFPFSHKGNGNKQQRGV